MNAHIVYRIQTSYVPSAHAVAAIQAVSIQDDLDVIRPPVTVCEDVTTDEGLGNYSRSIKLAYSPDFEAAYPTASAKAAVLRNIGKNILAAQIPARVIVHVFDVEANNCP
jgi:hypothetical protein